MKQTGYFVSLVILLIIGTSMVSADSLVAPELAGNWTGTSIGHDRAGGYDGPSGWQFIMSITEQRDRAFNGTISYAHVMNPDKNGIIGFSGVIGPDMKTLYLSEYGAGLVIGQIIDQDTLELIYLETGEDASAAIDTFTRAEQK